MKKAFVLFFTLLLMFSLVACGKTGEDPQPSSLYQLNAPQEGDTIVTIVTNKGKISAVLYPDQAPQTVRNFIQLVEKGYYDNTIIHKVIKDFVIQMGDPTKAGDGGESATGAGIPLEVNEKMHNFTGAIGMACGADQLAYSQFYIVAGSTVSDEYIAAMEQAGYSKETIDAYKERGGQPSLDYNYTIFGQVYEGYSVLKDIAGVKTDSYNRPNRDVRISTITISTYSEGA